MTDGEYRQELDAWERARAATERIVGTRGRSPQQNITDWGDEIDGGRQPKRLSGPGEGAADAAEGLTSAAGVTASPPSVAVASSELFDFAPAVCRVLRSS